VVRGRRARALAVRSLVLPACGALFCFSPTPAGPVHAASSSPVALAFYDGDTADFSGLAHLDRDHITHLAPSGLYVAADGGLHEVGDPKTLVRLAHASDVKVFQMVQNYRDGGAVTFDDGPDPRWTPRILDILRDYHARATFFVIGSVAAQHPDILRRMYAEGHEVANHTYTHAVDLEHASDWRFEFELSMTQRVIEAATGHSGTLFRYPYSDSLSDPGQDNLSLLKVAQQGYQIVGSGTDTRDWTRPGPALITSLALSAPDGQTVLLHDGGRRSQPDGGGAARDPRRAPGSRPPDGAGW